MNLTRAKRQTGFCFFSLSSNPNKPNHWCESTLRCLSQGAGAGLQWNSIQDGGKPKNVYFCKDSKPMWHVSCCVVLHTSSGVSCTVCLVPTGATQAFTWTSFKLFAFINCSENFASPGHCTCVWIMAFKSKAGLWLPLSCSFQLCKNLLP